MFETIICIVHEEHRREYDEFSAKSTFLTTFSTLATRVIPCKICKHMIVDNWLLGCEGHGHELLEMKAAKKRVYNQVDDFGNNFHQRLFIPGPLSTTNLKTYFGGEWGHQ